MRPTTLSTASCRPGWLPAFFALTTEDSKYTESLAMEVVGQSSHCSCIVWLTDFVSSRTPVIQRQMRCSSEVLYAD